MILHPEITPEAYVSQPQNKKAGYIKGIYIPCLVFEYVKIIYETSEVAFKQCFNLDKSLKLVPLNPYCHMYVDMYSYLEKDAINVVATKLYRSSYLTLLGKPSNKIVYGPVLIYGSMPILNKLKFFKDHSVPYEVVEQVFRLYENDCYEL